MKNKYNVPIVVNNFETERENIIYKRNILTLFNRNNFIYKRYINYRLYSIVIIKYKK